VEKGGRGGQGGKGGSNVIRIGVERWVGIYRAGQEEACGWRGRTCAGPISRHKELRREGGLCRGHAGGASQHTGAGERGAGLERGRHDCGRRLDGLAKGKMECARRMIGMGMLRSRVCECGCVFSAVGAGRGGEGGGRILPVSGSSTPRSRQVGSSGPS